VLEMSLYMPVYHTGTYFFLNFIPTLINIDCIHLFFRISLTVYPCFAFKKYTDTSEFSFRALIITVAVVLSQLRDFEPYYFSLCVVWWSLAVERTLGLYDNICDVSVVTTVVMIKLNHTVRTITIFKSSAKQNNDTNETCMYVHDLSLYQTLFV